MTFYEHLPHISNSIAGSFAQATRSLLEPYTSLRDFLYVRTNLFIDVLNLLSGRGGPVAEY